MYKERSTCRICNSNKLEVVLSLGDQFLTGIFPESKLIDITKGPLDLLRCETCSLIQLKHTYDIDEMYGMNYGYRSGLNQSMVNHLEQKARMLSNLVKLEDGDLVVDIGSNDATSLKAYSKSLKRVGIDPTGIKFREYYTDDIILIPDFFTADTFRKLFQNEKPKIISSIAMFYDLEDPKVFVSDIESILSDEGLWHFEQSYLPFMLRTNAYDTICHEHQEFYSLRVIENLLSQCGMRIIDVQTNDINGGSFAVTACKKAAAFKSNEPIIEWMLQEEERMGLNTPEPCLEFADRIFEHRDSLLDLLYRLKKAGKTVFGYGASTKGNVMLQFCNIGVDLVPYIAEVNTQKFGCFTPGTHIPIISEKEAKDMNPDYFLVFPWHFRHGILEREKAFREKGGKFIFPLPEIEII